MASDGFVARDTAVEIDKEAHESVTCSKCHRALYKKDAGPDGVCVLCAKGKGPDPTRQIPSPAEQLARAQGVEGGGPEQNRPYTEPTTDERNRDRNR